MLLFLERFQKSIYGYYNILNVNVNQKVSHLLTNF